MQQKEAVRCYRLKMITFTQTVAGKAAGARVVEWLRDILVTADVMLSERGGDVERVVQEIGGTLSATHTDGDRICTYLDGLGLER